MNALKIPLKNRVSLVTNNGREPAEEARNREVFSQGRSSSPLQQKNLVRLKVASGPTMGAGVEGKTWRDCVHCGLGKRWDLFGRIWFCQCEACTEPTAF